MQTSLTNKNKELIRSEPYVIYSGFELGKYPKLNALKELRFALESFYQVVILVDDITFSDDLLNFIQQGVFAEDKVSNEYQKNIFQKANILIENRLVRSLPKDISHPALVHIRNTFEEDINERVAPRLIKSQIKSWGLEHKRIKAFSRTKLEAQVQ